MQHFEGELVLRQNNMDEVWAAQIGQALEKGRGKLHTLDLACNTISNDGVRFLSVGISQSSTLTRLNLGMNRIDKQGLDYLADSLLVVF